MSPLPLLPPVKIFRASNLRRFTKTVQPVTHTHHGMLPNHARAGVTHHDPDLLAVMALVAMNRTFGAGRFFLAEPATVQPHARVTQKSQAFRAEPGSRAMLVAAIDSHHRFHRLPFAVQPAAGEGGARRRTSANGGGSNRFRSPVHAEIVAAPVREAIDASQRSGRFRKGGETRRNLT